MNKKKTNPGRFSSVVRAPVAQQVVLAYKKPAISTLSNGSIRIKHREFISDLSTSSTWSVVKAVAVQPGIGQSFPWLSRIAPNFESYKFEGLTYHITTMAPTTAPGTLGIAIDYDASDPGPTSKVQALAMQNSVRGPIWQSSFSLKANNEALNKVKERFVRVAATPYGQDVRLYDAGNVFVYCDGAESTGTIRAELHVEYTVILKTPQLGDLAAAANDASLMFNVPNSTSRMSTTDLGAYDNPFNIALAPVDTSPIAHTGGKIVPEQSYSIQGSENIYHPLRFNQTGRYTLDLNIPMTTIAESVPNWGFIFPSEFFANVRGALSTRRNSTSSTSGFQAAATIMFEVIKVGALLKLYGVGGLFRNPYRQFNISPVPMSWASPLYQTVQLAGVMDGEEGKEIYGIWMGDAPTRRRQSLTLAKQTSGERPEPTMLKVEDKVYESWYK